jgi:SAM-dependent methyltransferase
MESNHPDPARRFYQGDAGRRYHEVKRGIPAPALPWVARVRAEKFAPYIRPADVVLEYGVGLGWNLAQLRCSRKIGFDVADSAAEKVRALGIEFVSDIGAVPDQTADAAICHQTLEHLIDPFEALRQLSRILRPGGRLILHVPWERERRYRHYDPLEPNHHLYTWNAQNIGNLVALAEFKIQEVRVAAYGYDRFAASLACRFHLGEQGFRLVRRGLIWLRPLREVELIAGR